MEQLLASGSQWLRHIVDILLVAYLVYRGLLVIKGTRAAPMLWGLVIIVLFYFLARPLGLVTLAWILGNFLSSIILVVVVIFQDEIRRGLTKVGLQPIFHRTHKTLDDKTIEDITLVCSNLAKAKLGGLIVIQRDVGLDELIEDGVLLDAQLNRKLLYGIFVKESPLHDGAVVIENNRIKAANCVLPLSFNPDLDPNLGTRHRAAVGLSERSDALAIVVSEADGSISLAREGRIIRNLDPSLLRDSLHRFMANHVKAVVGEEAAL
ncbi:MAG: diadenylate cyclase CdaA [Oligoflexia bacterium]|nr:diadenylate cyclase CdaA [Oligoflexia bacterium]